MSFQVVVPHPTCLSVYRGLLLSQEDEVLRPSKNDPRPRGTESSVAESPKKQAYKRRASHEKNHVLYKSINHKPLR